MLKVLENETPHVSFMIQVGGQLHLKRAHLIEYGYLDHERMRDKSIIHFIMDTAMQELYRMSLTAKVNVTGDLIYCMESLKAVPMNNNTFYYDGIAVAHFLIHSKYKDIDRSTLIKNDLAGFCYAKRILKSF